MEQHDESKNEDEEAEKKEQEKRRSTVNSKRENRNDCRVLLVCVMFFLNEAQPSARSVYEPHASRADKQEVEEEKPQGGKGREAG